VMNMSERVAITTAFVPLVVEMSSIAEQIVRSRASAAERDPAPGPGGRARSHRRPRLLQGRSLDEGTAYGSLSSRERGNTDQAWQERRPVITSGPAFPAAVRRQQPRHVGGGELQLVARRRTAAGGQPARSSGTQPSHGSVQNEATYPATRRLSMSQRGEDTSVIGG
jgi:hypothetical protein